MSYGDTREARPDGEQTLTRINVKTIHTSYSYKP